MIKSAKYNLINIYTNYLSWTLLRYKQYNLKFLTIYLTSILISCILNALFKALFTENCVTKYESVASNFQHVAFKVPTISIKTIAWLIKKRTQGTFEGEMWFQEQSDEEGEGRTKLKHRHRITRPATASASATATGATSTAVAVAHGSIYCFVPHSVGFLLRLLQQEQHFDVRIIHS